MLTITVSAHWGDTRTTILHIVLVGDLLIHLDFRWHYFFAKIGFHFYIWLLEWRMTASYQFRDTVLHKSRLLAVRVHSKHLAHKSSNVLRYSSLLSDDAVGAAHLLRGWVQPTS